MFKFTLEATVPQILKCWKNTGQCEVVTTKPKPEISLLICLLDVPTSLALVFLHQKTYDWQHLVAENYHNQENNNMGLANEDLKYCTDSEVDVLIC